MSSSLVCGDVLQFQNQIKQMRDFDEKVVYSLNISLPTESIKAKSSVSPEASCKELFEHLKKGYMSRQTKINECVLSTADTVQKFRKQREEDVNDIQIEKKFKSEQRKLRILKQEQQVEEIVKEKTLKTFNDRCRQYFKMDYF
ncbi:unnamed protein product [Diamesa serratosioi]